ncbi:MAG: hypothetical protein JNM80_10465 [Phycisphaerae bacterium]|nr:hypothetical protein [Phycisphaerae bacterium]
MQTRSGLPTGLPIRRLEFTYDFLLRRATKEVFEPTAAPPSDDDEDQDGGSGGVTGDDGGGSGVAPHGWTSLGWVERLGIPATFRCKAAGGMGLARHGHCPTASKPIDPVLQ